MIDSTIEARSDCAASLAPSTGGGVWLSTPRWLLVPVTPAHAPLVARFQERNGDHFNYAMHMEPAMNEAQFWTPILEQQQQAALAGAGLFLLGFPKDGSARPEVGCAINFFGIVHEEFESCWLGYRMDRSLEGRGMMHEAVAPAIAKVFRQYRLHRMQASHRPENLRSGRLLRKLGFGIEGYARDFMKMNGQWHDNVLLSLINPGH